jgi:predicted glutamine amidotransferase
MCRLLGIAANESTEFRIALREAPKSLAALSREHRDGWGIAVYEPATEAWRIDRGLACAGEDARFHELAGGSRGELLISHVRKKTVGDVTLANTHPFLRGRWVFAHNGTILDIAWLRDHSCPRRLAEIEGQTDSEILFAWLLTKFDEAGVTGAPASAATDRALSAATRQARERQGFGAFSFLLSDGATTYAHRFGRSLFLLERGPQDAVRVRRESSDGTVVETPWSKGRTALFVASEQITAEPWWPLEDGMLLRIERAPLPSWQLIAA